MKTLLTVLFGILAVIGGIGVWACGVGSSVSMIAVILKVCGVSFVSGMSYWTPIWFIGGIFISMIATFISSFITALLAK